MKFDSEFFRPFLIFALLLILVGLGVLSWRTHEERRPVPVELRIVSATTSDPVFREGPRQLNSDEDLRLALAIRLSFPGRGDRWLAPVEELEIDGSRVEDVLVSRSWPEEDRFLRAFWFTLEPPFLGGIIKSKEDAASKLALRAFLAPEMGQGLIPKREPDWHADDDVNLGENLVSASTGTYRLYARIQVLSRPGSTHPLYTLSTPGPEAVDSPRMPRISRELSPDVGLDPAAGRLFRLPGFEAGKDSGFDPVPWTRKLRVVSSGSFAAVASTGHEEMTQLSSESSLQVAAGRFFRGKELLRWGKDIGARDLLRQGNHWIVLLKDDGDGILDTEDVVAQSWKRPPAILHLETIFDPTEGPIQLIQRDSMGP